MAFQKWDSVHGICQMNVFLNDYILFGFSRKYDLRHVLSASFPLGTVIQGAREKGRAHHRLKESQLRVRLLPRLLAARSHGAAQRAG